MYYRQCKLKKQTGNSVLEQVCFIPEEFAQLGHRLRIKKDSNRVGCWDTNWWVDFVSSIRVDDKHLPDSHKGIKSHRKSTGDNTPKVLVEYCHGILKKK